MAANVNIRYAGEPDMSSAMYGKAEGAEHLVKG
jgi:hypothetical protein